MGGKLAEEDGTLCQFVNEDKNYHSNVRRVNDSHKLGSSSPWFDCIKQTLLACKNKKSK